MDQSIGMTWSKVWRDCQGDAQVAAAELGLRSAGVQTGIRIAAPREKGEHDSPHFELIVVAVAASNPSLRG
jgi:hypothetical protein